MIPANRPPRVWQVDPNANTPPYDRALCAALAEAGCEVTLLTSRFVYEALSPPQGYRLREHFFRAAGSRIAERLGVMKRPGLRRALKAVEYPLDWAVLLPRLLRERPDIVHVQWSLDARVDLAIWRGLRQLGVPLVYTVHNLTPHDAAPEQPSPHAQLYRAAGALIVHSQRSAAVLQREHGVPAERITVVPHGPLLEAFPRISREAARVQLGLPPDAEIVLFAGLIEPYKGLADLIAAFAEVAARRPRARLVIAGKPNEPFIAYQRQLESLGLAERTTSDLAFLPEARLAAYLCAADVVVLPYRATTSSGLLLAARRFGCPVVATDVGDLSELIVDGERGLLVPPATPSALASAIERLLADPALAARLGRAGQETARGPGSWAEAARRTLDLYQRLLHR